jgi:hypothetical protein
MSEEKDLWILDGVNTIRRFFASLRMTTFWMNDNVGTVISIDEFKE